MDLFQKQWNVRILALLYQSDGARFAVLKHGLGVNADSLTRCLRFLVEKGWVQRNPGYGHPLRPEYILTPRGRSVAPQCQKLSKTVQRLDVAETVYRKWSIPLLVTINSGVVRFNSLRESLEINPRALTQGLQRLNRADLIMQQANYALTSSGSRLATLGAGLLRN